MVVVMVVVDDSLVVLTPSGRLLVVRGRRGHLTKWQALRMASSLLCFSLTSARGGEMGNARENSWGNAWKTFVCNATIFEPPLITHDAKLQTPFVPLDFSEYNTEKARYIMEAVQHQHRSTPCWNTE